MYLLFFKTITFSIIHDKRKFIVQCVLKNFVYFINLRKEKKINFSPAFHRRTKNAICCTKLDLAFISTYTFPIHL